MGGVRLEYTLIPNGERCLASRFPASPHYGKLKGQWIGGVSKAFRRIGCLRARIKIKSPVTLFATQLPDAAARLVLWEAFPKS